VTSARLDTVDNMASTQIKRQYVNPKVKSSFSGVHNVLRQVGHKFNKDQVQSSLASIPAYTLHKSARKRYPRRIVFIPSIRTQFIADLIDVSKYKKENGGATFLLSAIDGFSKVAHVVPLKNKSADSVVRGLKRVFRALGTPKSLQTDRGKEFYSQKTSKLFSDLNINHFSTGSDLKAPMIEIFNKTIMSKVARYMTHKTTKRFVNVLPQLVSNYNSSYHRSIRMSPNQVNSGNETQVYLNLYGGKKKVIPPRFTVGQLVLISKNKMIFEKGYAQSWSKEKFRIKSVHPTSPPTYTLEDMNKEEIFGIFYNEELQNINH